MLGRHRKVFTYLSILLIGIPGIAASWAGLFIEEPLIPYLIKKVGGVDMSSNPILIALPFVLMAIGVLLLFLIWREKKRIELRGLSTSKDDSKEKRQLKFDVGKLLLDGKEILVDLEKMDAKLDTVGVVSAELKFEMWYKDISKTLQNTDYAKLWDENKVGTDYHYKAQKSDYVEACKYGLDRPEYIKQLMFDKEDCQPFDALQPKELTETEEWWEQYRPSCEIVKVDYLQITKDANAYHFELPIDVKYISRDPRYSTRMDCTTILMDVFHTGEGREKPPYRLHSSTLPLRIEPPISEGRYHVELQQKWDLPSNELRVIRYTFIGQEEGEPLIENETFCKILAIGIPLIKNIPINKPLKIEDSKFPITIDDGEFLVKVKKQY